MTQEILEKHPIGRYVLRYEEALRFTHLHIALSSAAVTAAFLVSMLAYAILSRGMLPLEFSMHGNIAASIAAGLLVTSIALPAILIHYGCKISQKESITTNEYFLSDLRHEDSATVFDGHHELVATRFRYMLYKTYPKEHWQELMRYLDSQFFKQEDATIKSKTPNQVYDILYTADPVRFIKDIYVLKATFSGKKYLEDMIKGKLDILDLEVWSELILATHADLNKDKYKDVSKFELLKDMASHDPQKFVQAYATIAQSCSQKFRTLVENTILYQPHVMSKATVELLKLDLPRFILKYDELKQSKAEFSSNVENEIKKTLQHSTSQEWGRLLIAIDKAYFCKSSSLSVEEKRAIRSMLPQLDKDKFLQAYFWAQGQLSASFCELIDANFPTIVEDVEPSAELIKMYYATKSRLSEKLRTIEEKVNKNLNILTIDEWSELILATHQESSNDKIINVMVSKNPTKFVKAYGKIQIECSQKFRTHIENTILYQPQMMNNATLELLKLNLSRFMLKYDELKQNKAAVSPNVKVQIESFLKQSASHDWGRLLIAIDKAYFSKSSSHSSKAKTALLSMLLELDNDKFLQGYFWARDHLSKSFCEHCDTSFKPLMPNLEPSAQLIKIYHAVKPHLPKTYRDIFDSKTKAFLNQTNTSWVDLLRSHDNTSSGNSEGYTPENLIDVMVNLNHTRFRKAYTQVKKDINKTVQYSLGKKIDAKEYDVSRNEAGKFWGDYRHKTQKTKSPQSK